MRTIETRYIFFPRWIGSRGIIWGLLALLLVALIFSSRLMPFYLYVFFVVEVVVFFVFSKNLTHSWKIYNSDVFVKRILIYGILLRIPLTLYYHLYYSYELGSLYFKYLADVEVYVGLPYYAVENILNNGDWDFINKLFLPYIALDDFGAPIFNTILLLLTGNISPCGVPLMANIFLGAYTSVFVYNIAKRHYGEDVARMSAIFCMLNPNLIWWCSSLMKEIQMTFFTFWFLDRIDRVLIKGSVSAAEVLPCAFIGMFVFLYRAALGILLFASFFITLLFINKRVVSTSKKIAVGIFTAFVLLFGFGQQMLEQTEKLKDNVESGGQEVNMNWRSTRQYGNKFAVYASAAVFAPMIFTIPFPTLSYTHEAQISLMEVAGGNYIKNILSFFVILSMFMLLFSGGWKLHVLLITYLIGYLLILVVSAYAQSGRFHVPALPFEMMFAAYGIKQVLNSKPIKGNFGNIFKYKRWYSAWCFIMLVACISWQWFKLEGQGLL